MTMITSNSHFSLLEGMGDILKRKNYINLIILLVSRVVIGASQFIIMHKINLGICYLQ